ncbi:unnamed protein product [Mytilus coruscus]|uniref:DDE Tnp4 domain-containing protein n=1 Tax=Mytilus coruscus TaxID=42192 RepID=A0A6J8CH06_MYTCO|nr:unnamed protein product [Mytilus coruscus]
MIKNNVIQFISTPNPRNTEAYNIIYRCLTLLMNELRLKRAYQIAEIIKSNRQPKSLEKLLTNAKLPTEEERIYDCPQPTAELMLSYTDGITQTPSMPMFSAEDFANDDTAMHFYTGLESYTKFLFVLTTLGPAAHCDSVMADKGFNVQDLFAKIDVAVNIPTVFKNDRQIVERCRIVQLCDPGDSVMADKGFNVQDLFAKIDVAVNIPTVFKK